jgi:ABC-type lipoprotein export system ATPase subunit
MSKVANAANTNAPTMATVVFDDVFVLYQNVVALRGLSLELRRGERVVVRGPSGSGKSTLVNLVTGQVQPTAGSLTFFDDGVMVHGELLRRRGQLCVISQGSGRELVPEIDCIRNVALTTELTGSSKREALERAHELLARFDISHLANRMPTDVSSGEAQRVALAAALSASPSIIVADEPTGELDRASAEQIYALLSDHVVATGATLLLVSHDQRAESIADRVLTIRDGRLERSRERGATESALAVDSRGWMRLPEAQRSAAGIAQRALVTLASDGLGLRVQSADSTDTPESVAFVGEATDSSPGELVIEGVGVSVRIDGVVALAPVSFGVHRGALTVIAGASGSGKTTLLSVLGELRGPTTGTVQRHARLSKVFAAQVSGFADDATVRENVLIAARLRGVEVPDSVFLNVVGALGIEHLIGRPARTLSGGERQRAGVARALLCPAELMLIDEPTSQLDEASTVRTIAALHAAAHRGAAVVVATHDDAVVAAADVVIRVGD